MKKNLLIHFEDCLARPFPAQRVFGALLAFLFAATGAWAQRGQSGMVLDGYDGAWTRQGKIEIFDLVRFYPDRLPFLRNEIYARYGRPFVNQVYQDYFNSQSWYRVRNNYTDAWLSADDKYNAEFIRSVEQPALGFADTVKALIQNVEYEGTDVLLTFTSKEELRIEDNPYDFYGRGLTDKQLPWIIMGDWVLTYEASGRQNYALTAYKLDHRQRRITDSAQATISAASLNVLIEAQKNR